MITMLLKHLRGFGLFTSAQIKISDANNLFDGGGGQILVWIYQQPKMSLEPQYYIATFLLFLFNMVRNASHMSLSVYIIETELTK